MKTRILTFAFTIFIATISIAQETADTVKYWTKSGTLNLNFSQASFTNWAAGGENSFTLNSLVNLNFNYKKGKTTWDNRADLGYGLLHITGGNVIKNDDRIDLTSKWGRHAFGKWSYSGLVNFKSQFSPTYNNPQREILVSDFMSPGYLLLSLGMDFRPNDNFSLYVSPLTGKITFVFNNTLANAGAYGVAKAEYAPDGSMIRKGDRVRKEIGAYMSLNYKKNLMENIFIQTKVDLFSNYLNNPGNIDIYWDMLLSMKVNKFITTTLITTLIYDDDIDIPTYKTENGVKTQIGLGPKTQFREVLAIGFSYKFLK